MFEFPKRWPPVNSTIIQLYTLPTPNGQKVSIMLEGVGLEYEPHRIDIMKGDQFDPDFIEMNPNSKIPVLIDPNGPGQQPMVMMETGAILIYLAEKTGKFLPTDPITRLETLQWLFFQVAHIGPMFGQFGHFYKFAADKVTDDYPMFRYRNEAKRLLAVLEHRLEARQWLMGDELTIADIAVAPWLKALDVYEAHDELGTQSFVNVLTYRDRFYELPFVQRGSIVGASAS